MFQMTIPKNSLRSTGTDLKNARFSMSYSIIFPLMCRVPIRYGYLHFRSMLVPVNAQN